MQTQPQRKGHSRGGTSTHTWPAAGVGVHPQRHGRHGPTPSAAALQTAAPPPPAANRASSRAARRPRRRPRRNEQPPLPASGTAHGALRAGATRVAPAVTAGGGSVDGRRLWARRLVDKVAETGHAFFVRGDGATRVLVSGATPQVEQHRVAGRRTQHDGRLDVDPNDRRPLSMEVCHAAWRPRSIHRCRCAAVAACRTRRRGRPSSTLASTADVFVFGHPGVYSLGHPWVDSQEQHLHPRSRTDELPPPSEPRAAAAPAVGIPRRAGGDHDAAQHRRLRGRLSTLEAAEPPRRRQNAPPPPPPPPPPPRPPSPSDGHATRGGGRGVTGGTPAAADAPSGGRPAPWGGARGGAAPAAIGAAAADAPRRRRGGSPAVGGRCAVGGARRTAPPSGRCGEGRGGRGRRRRRPPPPPPLPPPPLPSPRIGAAAAATPAKRCGAAAAAARRGAWGGGGGGPRRTRPPRRRHRRLPYTQEKCGERKEGETGSCPPPRVGRKKHN